MKLKKNRATLCDSCKKIRKVERKKYWKLRHKKNKEFEVKK